MPVKDCANVEETKTATISPENKDDVISVLDDATISVETTTSDNGNKQASVSKGVKQNSTGDGGSRKIGRRMLGCLCVIAIIIIGLAVGLGFGLTRNNNSKSYLCTSAAKSD